MIGKALRFPRDTRFCYVYNLVAEYASYVTLMSCIPSSKLRIGFSRKPPCWDLQDWECGTGTLWANPWTVIKTRSQA
jgi:hypothetical protein